MLKDVMAIYQEIRSKYMNRTLLRQKWRSFYIKLKTCTKQRFGVIFITQNRHFFLHPVLSSPEIQFLSA